MSRPTIFNPLDKANLAESVVHALLAQPAVGLDQLAPFEGSGVYALYYTGDHPAYRPLALLNRGSAKVPIYVGKAIPQGGRKGGMSLEGSSGSALYKRLKEHAESIEAAADLRVEHFQSRSLAVDDIWIALGENMLIQRYQPLWNLVVDGFGNHNPGKGRAQGMRPLWDELHPGRTWAKQLQAPKLSRVEILKSVARYMVEKLPSSASG